MKDRLKTYGLALLVCVTVALVAAVIIDISAEPAASALSRAVGTHPTMPILPRSLVRELSLIGGLATFIGCIRTLLESPGPRRRRTFR